MTLLHLHLRRKQQPVGWRANLRKAQSMVEIAIIFPVLLLVLTGLVEFGFMLNDYLTILDAARNAARFSADSNYTTTDPVGSESLFCDGPDATIDFYRQTACLVCIELANEKPPINPGLLDGAGETKLQTITPDWQINGTYFNCPLDSSQDEVIISAISVEHGAPATATILGSPWKLYGQTPAIDPKIDAPFVVDSMVTSSPDAGFLAVEVLYHYEHILGLPWIGVFLGNPTELHVYTVMPLASGEPTSTVAPP